MSKKNSVYLKHIDEAAGNVLSFTRGVAFEDFKENRLMQSAVVRELMIVGEATKNLSEDFRTSHPQVPWRSLARTRDKLIHGYFGIDLGAVWSMVTRDVPKLKASIEGILRGQDLD